MMKPKKRSMGNGTIHWVRRKKISLIYNILDR